MYIFIQLNSKTKLFYEWVLKYHTTGVIGCFTEQQCLDKYQNQNILNTEKKKTFNYMFVMIRAVISCVILTQKMRKIMKSPLIYLVALYSVHRTDNLDLIGQFIFTLGKPLLVTTWCSL